MGTMLETLYAAAARAGLLKSCRWMPPDGSPPQTHEVGFAAPDETLLDGLASGTAYAMTYPASRFAGLAVRDSVEIDGVVFQVRDIRAVGDGSELRARLAPL
ncbi:MAG TPA: hypothetical protein VFL86_05170 [Burkholderiaceae bacterium]|nr:hypothetical protein [Burkholderiaceae bacterium]